jgi:hypothetical protein
MKNKVVAFLIFTILFFSTSVYGATFKGKVIDADTKEPIEGAVVVASWIEEKAAPAGPYTRLKDVIETLTDKEGKWSITGPEGAMNKMIPRLLSLIGMYVTKEPTFIVFKPGYCPWSVSAFGIDACKEKLKPTGSTGFIRGETVELPKLKKKEDRLKATRVGPIFNGRNILKKQKIFIRLLSEERRNVGLSELKVLEELENEK